MMQTSARRFTSVWPALIAVYVLWGSTYPAIRMAVETMPPLAMAGARFLIAGAVLFLARLPAAWRAGEMPTASQWKRAVIIGCALLVGGNGAVAWAEQTVPSGIAALIVASVPLWMAAIDGMIYRRRLPALAAIGLMMGFCGVAVLVGAHAMASGSIAGTLVLVGGSISWAAGSLYSRGAKMPDDSLLWTGMQMLAGGAILCLLGFVTGD